MKLVLVEFTSAIQYFIQQHSPKLWWTNIVVVEVVNNHGRKFVQVHVFNVFKHESVNHLGQLHDFSQEDGIIFNSLASFQMVGSLDYK